MKITEIYAKKIENEYGKSLDRLWQQLQSVDTLCSPSTATRRALKGRRRSKKPRTSFTRFNPESHLQHHTVSRLRLPILVCPTSTPTAIKTHVSAVFCGGRGGELGQNMVLIDTVSPH